MGGCVSRQRLQLAHGGGRLDRMAPALSAHTEEVLASLGYDAKAIAELRTRECGHAGAGRRARDF